MGVLVQLVTASTSRDTAAGSSLDECMYVVNNDRTQAFSLYSIMYTVMMIVTYILIILKNTPNIVLSPVRA